MLNLKEKALFSRILFFTSKPVDLSGPHGFESHSRRQTLQNIFEPLVAHARLRLQLDAYFKAFSAMTATRTAEYDHTDRYESAPILS